MLAPQPLANPAALGNDAAMGRLFARLVLALPLLWAFLASEGVAKDFRIGSLEIVQPWARATPKGAKVAGGYMKIVNRGPMPDRLTGGTSPVGRVEIHEMSMQGGVMRMRELAQGIEIGAGATVELRPGSLHVMLQDLARPLVKGERVKGTLVFEKAGSVEIEYEVVGVGEGMRGPAH
jgi:copper(I)-binding protein